MCVRSCRSPNANNRIFWVTDNDDPVKGNTQLIDVLRLKRTVCLMESRSPERRRIVPFG